MDSCHYCPTDSSPSPQRIPLSLILPNHRHSYHSWNISDISLLYPLAQGRWMASCLTFAEQKVSLISRRTLSLFCLRFLFLWNYVRKWCTKRGQSLVRAPCWAPWAERLCKHRGRGVLHTLFRVSRARSQGSVLLGWWHSPTCPSETSRVEWFPRQTDLTASLS